MAGILVATHGGPTADAAVLLAMQLAERRQTTLHAVCVFEPLPLVGNPFGAVYVPNESEEEWARTALLDSVSHQLTRLGSGAKAELRVGPAPTENAAAARSRAAELIVVGLGRASLLERALGHETALQLVQLASTPVLAVPLGMTTLPRRIVAAIDFSPTSVAAARLAASLLDAGDLLCLANVIAPWREDVRLSPRAAVDGALAAVEREIDVPDGVQVERRLVEGVAASQLLELAAELEADLIALGSHGYGIWKRLTIGSVASKIIRTAERAVLVLPIGSLAATAGSGRGRDVLQPPGS
jgi:nucleotide-binding universal stress UspA family protein